MRPACLVLGILVVACGCTNGSERGQQQFDGEYAFVGRTGESSVAYNGQVLRNLLLDDGMLYLGGLARAIEDGRVIAPGDVSTDLAFYLQFDGASGGGVAIVRGADEGLLQTTYGEIGDASIYAKLAGNDETGQTRDWSLGLSGWSSSEPVTPQGLVDTWVQEVDVAAVAWSNGDKPLTPSGEPIAEVYLSADGVDRRQLLESFVRGAMGFSQAADDYLDNDIEGKGLLADHSAVVEGKSYTELEHQWDEAFGYFGASRDYLDRGGVAVRGAHGFDTNGDGAIDVRSEWNTSWAVEAAGLATEDSDGGRRVFEALGAGRQIIADASTSLTESEMEQLVALRDEAVLAWEGVIAARAIASLNAVLEAQSAAETEGYSFEVHAQHWAKLKGCTLGFQFNPDSRMSGSDFERLHELIGDKPAVDSASFAAYEIRLLEARSLLARTYELDEE